MASLCLSGTWVVPDHLNQFSAAEGGSLGLLPDLGKVAKLHNNLYLHTAF